MTSARTYDSAQKEAYRHLQNRLEALNSQKRAAPRRLRGLYLYGPVGRGKTMLMDTFFSGLHVPKKRFHFYDFVLHLHEALHVSSDVRTVTRDLAQSMHVLCLDEFFIADIASAMLIGRVLEHLLPKCVVVTTSNDSLESLYRDGFQRDRFLPFLKTLQASMDSVHLNGPIDYRTAFLPPQAPSLPREREGMLRVPFDHVCGRPLGAQEFTRLALKASCVVLEDVPTLSDARPDHVLRLVTLVDVLFEKETPLYLDAPSLSNLYQGHRYAHEMARTLSRLKKMRATLREGPLP